MDVFSTPEWLHAGGWRPRAEWLDVVGCSLAIDGTLVKTAATGWGNAAARSAIILPLGTDGAVEWTLAANSYGTFCGLTHLAADGLAYQDIAFALYPYWDGALNFPLFMWEVGAQVEYVGQWAAGDRVRISVEGSAVKVYQNDALVGTFPSSPAGDLRLAVVPYEQGNGLGPVTLRLAGDQEAAPRSFTSVPWTRAWATTEG